MVWKIPNLWPELIAQSGVITPRAILQRQVQVLAERSENMVQGEITTRVLGPDLVQNLHIVAPELEGFRYFVVRVRHSLQHPYPLQVQLNESDSTGKECATEEAFIEELRDILHAPRILNVVNSLLAQTTASVG